MCTYENHFGKPPVEEQVPNMGPGVGTLNQQQHAVGLLQLAYNREDLEEEEEPS